MEMLTEGIIIIMAIMLMRIMIIDGRVEREPPAVLDQLNRRRRRRRRWWKGALAWRATNQSAAGSLDGT